MNGLWGGLLGLGILLGFASKNPAAVTQGIVSGARDAIRLAITMLGMVAFWSGILNVAEKSGELQRLERWMRPLFRRLFPEVSELARKKMTQNVAANMLGLGWAATPAGLEAMKQLTKENPTPMEMSDAMCLFLLINISSVQLIPMTLIAIRAECQSTDPAGIIAGGLIATSVSTLTAIGFGLGMKKRRKR